MDETWEGGHLNDPAWWWNIATDGLLSGLITGLVAAVAIWITVRHERRLGELSELRVATAQLQGLAFRASIRMLSERPGQPWHEDAMQVPAATLEVSARAGIRWPDLSGLLFELSHDLMKPLGKKPFDAPSGATREQFRVTLLEVTRVCAHWLVDPDAFSREEFEARQAARESAAVVAAPEALMADLPETPPQPR